MGWSQTANFTFTTSSGRFCAPATVQFTPTVTGRPMAYLWKFSNGVVSTSANPSVTFDKAGKFSAQLTVIFETSAVETTKDITVNPAASINVDADRKYICRPGPVSFTSSGTVGAGSYSWTFGDNTSDNGTKTSVTHNYAAMGNYAVNLRATDRNGCVATSSINVEVAPPAITANISAREGCIPANISYSASANLPIGGSVTNYQWGIGNGTTINTTNGNLDYTYSRVGNYNPTLTITTNEGCRNSFSFGGIAFGTPPTNPRATIAKDTICGSDSVYMTSTAGNANRYNWDFGDGNGRSIGSTGTGHKYTTLGDKFISVTPFYNGCPAAQQNLKVHVEGVIANYFNANTCNNRQTFNFTDLSLGNVTSRVWKLGDGNTVNDIPGFQHTYSSTGTYQSNLTVYDNTTGCSDYFARTVYYATPSLSVTDSLLCKGSSFSITINNNYSNNSASYTWYAAGDTIGPAGNASLNRYATRKLGLFNSSVIIDNGAGYCADTIRASRPLRVRGIKMDVSMPPSMCVYDSLQVVNRSAAFNAADTVRLWYWNFGPSKDTSYQPKVYKYTDPGYYTVTAYGRDKNGCIDSVASNFVVNPAPFVKTLPGIDTICLGQRIPLYAFHSDSLVWSPLNLAGCLNCDTLQVSPPATTLFKAIAINPAGCTSADSALIKVFSPFTATASFTDTAICATSSIQLNALPNDKKTVWVSPTTGLSATNIANPIATPPQTTTYKVALTDSAGCYRDTATINVAVLSLPTVDAGPDKLYPFNSDFTFEPVYSANVRGYQWSPSELLSCTDCAIPTGRNEVSKMYTVTAISDSGCTAKDSVRILVECKDAYLNMPSGFTPDGNGNNDYFYPLTRGISLIKKFAIYNRLGQLLYSVSNFEPNKRQYGWDGRFNGNMQTAGAYVYMLEALCDAGEVLTKKGTVTLLR